VKVFLNLHAGLTRGAVPNREHHKEQAEKLRNVIREQRKELKKRDQQIKEQAENLTN